MRHASRSATRPPTAADHVAVARCAGRVLVPSTQNEPPMTDLLPVNDPVLVFALVALLILLAPIIMARYRLPGMIGLLLAGAVLGPNALGVLARDQSFVLFGTVGLLYIMFTAALEIDMAVLKRYRVHSVVFGLLTFAVPQGVGTLVGRLLGFDWPAALLTGAMFASHTLLPYPIASRLGIVRNPAVTTAVGGTIITDTLALLVLAVIAGAAHGTMDEAFWYRLAIGLTIYVLAILIGLPRLARWFFRNVGRGDGVTEFVFVLATVFGCASLAHLAGAEPILGAFLAGLALNRLIPHNSTLMNRIRFTGEAVFVPFFLLSVGMLLDVRIFAGDLRAWLVAAALVVTVGPAKWLAAAATRVLLGYDRDQAGVVFGLSLAHAAATLAVTSVGHGLGLFDDAVVNGAILMILVTCVAAPWLVDRHGRNLAIAQEEAELEPSGPPQRILVALSKPETAPRLLELAQMVRDPAQGQPLYPLSVVEDVGGSHEQIARVEKMLAEAMHDLAAAEVPAQPLTPIDLNFADGVLRARREQRGTEVIVGWSAKTTPEFFFGSMLERLLRDRHYTLIVSRTERPLNTCHRVVLAIPPHADHEHGFPEAVGIVKRLARQLGAPLVVLTEKAHEARVRKRVQAVKPAVDVKLLSVEHWSSVPLAIADFKADDDLLVLYGVRTGGLAWRPLSGNLHTRLAERFPATSLLVIYPAEPREERLAERVAVAVPGTV